MRVCVWEGERGRLLLLKPDKKAAIRKRDAQDRYLGNINMEDEKQGGVWNHSQLSGLGGRVPINAFH